MPNLREQLKQCFQGSACLVGLGNPDYGDDGLGVKLAEAISERLTGMGKYALVRHVVNAGATPERFIGPVKELGCDHLIFIDAVDFGGETGSAILLDEDEMEARFPQISTHKISVKLLAKLFGENGRTKVRLLGVQPRSLQSGKGLTPVVQKTVDILSELLCDLLVAGKQVDHCVEGCKAEALI